MVDENERLLGACQDLKKGDIRALGLKMFETHQGLKLDYEVSCRELDFLVDQVKANEDVAGARMVGGGFGGCTINLIKDHAAEDLIATVGRNYKKETGLPLTTYEVSLEDGTSACIQST